MSKPLTWTQLNDELRKVKDQDKCYAMLEAEAKTTNRNLFVRRIYGKFSKLRAARERKLFKI